MGTTTFKNEDEKKGETQEQPKITVPQSSGDKVDSLAFTKKSKMLQIAVDGPSLVSASSKNNQGKLSLENVDMKDEGAVTNQLSNQKKMSDRVNPRYNVENFVFNEGTRADEEEDNIVQNGKCRESIKALGLCWSPTTILIFILCV